MPTKIRLEPHLSSKELEERYGGADDPILRSHYQIIRSIPCGKRTTEVMGVTAYGGDWIRKLALSATNEDGPHSLGDRKHANLGAKGASERGAPTRAFRGFVEGPPEDGGMWSSRKVAQWIEQKSAGKPVRKQRGWECLSKFGRTPEAPRPAHAEADKPEQEAFSKESPD